MDALLEQIRPAGMPSFFPGLSSEIATHRIAMRCDGKKAVYIPRRDTSSRLNHWVGDRLFPGEHAPADFEACQEGLYYRMIMTSKDKNVAIDVNGNVAKTGLKTLVSRPRKRLLLSFVKPRSDTPPRDARVLMMASPLSFLIDR